MKFLMKTIREDDSPNEVYVNEGLSTKLCELILARMIRLIRLFWRSLFWRSSHYEVYVNRVLLTKLCESVSVNEITVKMIRLMKCLNEVKANEVKVNEVKVKMIHLTKFSQWSYVNEIMVKKIHIIKSFNEVMWRRFLIK
jgi:hypothetical protein